MRSAFKELDRWWLGIISVCELILVGARDKIQVQLWTCWRWLLVNVVFPVLFTSCEEVTSQSHETVFTAGESYQCCAVCPLIFRVTPTETDFRWRRLLLFSTLKLRFWKLGHIFDISTVRRPVIWRSVIVRKLLKTPVLGMVVFFLHSLYRRCDEDDRGLSTLSII